MTEQIAIFTRDLSEGGVGRVIVNLSRAFARRGIAVDVVLARGRGPYLEQLPKQTRIVDLGAGRTLAGLPGLIRYLRHEKPKVLVSFQDWANVVALCAMRLAGGGVRVLTTTHTALSRDARSSPHLRRRLLPRLVQLSYGWADTVIAVSQGVADDLANIVRLDRDRLRVIYNPFDLEAIATMAQAPLDHSWFRQGEPPVLLSVGRLTRQKDFPTLLKAFDRVRRERSARLMILGEGGERAALEVLARELGCENDVALPGFVANPYPYMAAARAFVMSSAWEGFGNVLVEAMALGTPVVATDCPSGPAEILEQGRYGTLVPVGDVEALAGAMGTALEGPRHANSGIARADAFSAERIANQYLAAIDRRGSARSCRE